MSLRIALIIAGVSFGLFLLVLLLSLSARRPGTQTQPVGNQPTQPTPRVSLTYDYDPSVTPLPGMALVSGKLCSSVPEYNFLPRLKIVAEQIPSREKYVKFYPGLDVAGTDQYFLQLEPGVYEFYTEDYQGNKLAIYSRFVTCGMGETCFDHRPIEVELMADEQVPNIDICDYQWNLEKLPTPTPTRVLRPTRSLE